MTKFEKLKNTYCRILYSEQDGLIGFLIRLNYVFYKIKWKCCLKLPSESGNLRQVHFLCKFRITWNLSTLRDIVISFGGMNYTYIRMVHTTCPKILTNIFQETVVLPFFAIEPNVNIKITLNALFSCFNDLKNKIKCDSESANWALQDSVKFLSKCRRILLS